MMRFDASALALIFALGVCAALAGEVPVTCVASESVSIEGLDRTACRVSGTVMIERYSGPKSTSLYATDLDQRELAVAYGKDSASVKAMAGVEVGVNDSVTQSRLLQPRMATQLSTRDAERRVNRHRNWAISTVQVEYGAQGGARGFPLSCATAIRSSAGTTVIVAECFPLEERSRFYKTLDLIR